MQRSAFDSIASRSVKATKSTADQRYVISY